MYEKEPRQDANEHLCVVNGEQPFVIATVKNPVIYSFSTPATPCFITGMFLYEG